MAEFKFDPEKLSKALGVAKGLGDVGLAWAGSYFNVPKAESNVGFRKKANTLANWNYGLSDMAGAVRQIENTPVLQDINGRDLYNPSGQEQFGSLFNAGLTSYAAATGLTSGLKGNMGSTYLNGTSGFNTATGKGWGDIGNAAEQAYAANNKAFEGEEGQKQLEGMFGINIPHACGGHLHGCGGHKYDVGGAIFDNGNAVAEALNLTSGGIGVLLNYLGQRNEMAQAEAAAEEVNAANAYARQLTSHNQGELVNNVANNMARIQGLQLAMGGDLQTHGAEYPLLGDYNFIGAGGTHEQNPFGGVYQGMAMDGKPNLVEEDEVVWNDYVFSNRIPVDEKFVKQYKLKKGITYADAAQKLSREAEERPNDPISQNGLADALSALMDSQEIVKQKREAARIKRQIAKMSPEEVMDMMTAYQRVQQAPTEQQLAMVQPEQPMFAEGGHLYEVGGPFQWYYDELFNADPGYTASTSDEYLPYDANMGEEEVKKIEKLSDFTAWTDYVLANWDTDFIKNYLKKLDEKAGGNHLFDKNGNLKKGAKDYFVKARTKNHKLGFYHWTPELLEESAIAARRQALATAQQQTNSEQSTEGNKQETDNNGTKDNEEKKEEMTTKPIVPLQTLTRQAPVWGAMAGLMMSSAPAKDYSTAFAPRTATYAPIGNYLPFLPVDTQRYINAENQQAAAQLNAIMNASAGNKNMALAQGAFARQQRQQNIGQILQAAEAINWDRLRQTGEFNRGTNMFNAQGFNQSELADLGVNHVMLRQAQQNAAMKHAVDVERDTAMSQNATALTDALRDIGRENFIANQINSNLALDYGLDMNPFLGGLSFFKRTPKDKKESSSTESNSVALGGYLLSKPKKNRR